ncbi:MAG: helix-turn-helix domain-containing protein [Actinobacteria bacterium]|nr:helix-turn-helix domain-containing protein [Actinomycetota bacterium]
MEPLSAVPPGVQQIVTAVEASLEKLVSAATDAIWAEVPAYAASPGDQLRNDVTAHIQGIFEAFLDGVRTGRPARRSDFEASPEQASRRVVQGITLADFLRAFRIGQLTLWQGVLDAAGDDAAARDAALSMVAHIMQMIELGSTIVAEAYVTAQQQVLAEGDRVRRDVLEDLLARRVSPAGPKRGLLRAVGLEPDTELLVIAAALTGDLPEGVTVRDAAAGVAGGRRGLAVVRQDEVVGVMPLPAGGAAAAVTGVRRSCADLARRGVRLAVGVSTVHAGLAEVPEAYAEAQTARDGLGGSPGVLALPALTSFDYLVLRDDKTARRLIRPQVRKFVADDLAAGGTLITTLVEFAACDMNAKTAAERLHLHVNTAYYRLERIAERTGCDLRRLADVMELLVAVRLLGAA